MVNIEHLLLTTVLVEIKVDWEQSFSFLACDVISGTNVGEWFPDLHNFNFSGRSRILGTKPTARRLKSQQTSLDPAFLYTYFFFIIIFFCLKN